MTTTNNTLHTYHVSPANGEKPYEVKASRYEHDVKTGHHLFYAHHASGDELVANLLNVSVRKA